MPDEEFNPELNYATEFVRAIFSVLGKIRLYPPGHPIIKKTIYEDCSIIIKLLENRENLTLSVVENTLLIDDKPLEESVALYHSLAEFLKRRNIYSITFSNGVRPDELLEFFNLLCRRSDILKQEGGIEKLVEENANIEKIAVNEIEYGIISGSKDLMNIFTPEEAELWKELVKMGDFTRALMDVIKENPKKIIDLIEMMARHKTGGTDVPIDVKVDIAIKAINAIEEEVESMGEDISTEERDERISQLLLLMEPDIRRQILTRGILDHGWEQIGEKVLKKSKDEILATEIVTKLVEVHEASKIEEKVEGQTEEKPRDPFSSGIYDLQELARKPSLPESETLIKIKSFVEKAALDENLAQKMLEVLRREFVRAKISKEEYDYITEKLEPKEEIETIPEKPTSTLSLLEEFLEEKTLAETMSKFIKMADANDDYGNMRILDSYLKTLTNPTVVIRIKSIAFIRRLLNILLQKEKHDMIMFVANSLKNFVSNEIVFRMFKAHIEILAIIAKEMDKRGIMDIADFATDALIELLHRDSPNIMVERKLLVDYLGKIGTTRAMEALLKEYDKMDIHKEIHSILLKNGHLIIPSLLNYLHSAENKFFRLKIMEILMECGKTGTDLYAKDLTSPYWYDRRNALILLGNFGDKKHLEKIVALTNDPNEKVRDQAYQTLIDIYGLEGEIYLLNALKDPSETIRKTAIKLLQKVGTTKCVETLQNILKSKSPIFSSQDEDFRVRICKTLGNIGSPSSIEVLLQALKDDSVQVQIAAAFALGQIGSPLALEGLKKAAKSKNSVLRNTALKAIDQIENPPKPKPPVIAVEKQDQKKSLPAAEEEPPVDFKIEI